MRRSVIGFILGFVLALSVGGYADTVFQFKKSQNIFYVDGQQIKTPAYVYQNTNYAPFRAVAEALGMDVAVAGTRVDITRPLTDLETVAKNCKNSCVMIYAYGADNTMMQGSGWVYNGYVVTAKHVVEGAKKIDVFTDDSLYSVPGTIHYMDKLLDVAILKADTKMPSVKLGDSSKLVEGQKLVSITSPKGVQNSIDECVYSGRLVTKTQDEITLTDTFMNNGSSGGAVFDYDSQIYAMAFNGPVGTEKIIGAIPINDIKPILSKLK